MVALLSFRRFFQWHAIRVTWHEPGYRAPPPLNLPATRLTPGFRRAGKRERRQGRRLEGVACKPLFGLVFVPA
jgi:hypothetical protein